jgi:hypothetical protein
VKKLRSPNQLILKINNIDIFFNIVKKLRFPNLKKSIMLIFIYLLIVKKLRSLLHHGRRRQYNLPKKKKYKERQA